MIQRRSATMPRRALLHLTFIAIPALLMLAGPVAEVPAAKGSTHSCGSLIITPQSDNALLHIRTRGIGCRSARRRLRAWAKHGYRPMTGPRGYRCKMPTPYQEGQRIRCHRKGHRLPVISFQ